MRLHLEVNASIFRSARPLPSAIAALGLQRALKFSMVSFPVGAVPTAYAKLVFMSLMKGYPKRLDVNILLRLQSNSPEH